MKHLKFLLFFFITLIPLFTAKPVLAGFGVSPAEIYNDSLKPGAKFEKDIVISRSDIEEELRIVIETDLGDAESWIRFEPSREFIFPKGEQRKTIKVIIAVPNNVELKNYKGFLRIKASSTDVSASGVSIVKGARMDVTLVTTSLNVNVLSIKGLNIPNVDFQKPIKLLVNVENSGNTDAAPSKIILEIQDLNKNILETQEVTKLEKVAPNTTKEITAEFKNNLASGEYFGIVKVYLDDKELRSDRLVFKVGTAPAGYSPSSTSSKGGIFNKLISLVKNNKVETLAIFLIPLLPAVVGYIISKKSKRKSVKKLFLIASIIYLIIAITLIILYHQKRIANMAKPGDVGNVQGESIEAVPTVAKIPIDNSSSLTINKEAGYPIYRAPDINSHIVYTAEENEKFKVIREEGDWYYVTIKNGTGGWLSKTSVKKSE